MANSLKLYDVQSYTYFPPYLTHVNVLPC